MTIFFTSDLHFNHRSIVHLGKGRPWNTVEEMNEGIIENWNKVVKPGDIVYILGDLALGGEYDKLEDCMRRLNANKHVVIGNHDREKELAQLRNKNIIQSMRDYHKVKIEYKGNPFKIILSHFPILEFDGVWRKHSMHLYGHIHDMNNYDDLYKQLGFPALHIGLDTSDRFPNTAPYTPIRLEDILERMESEFGIIDKNRTIDHFSS